MPEFYKPGADKETIPSWITPEQMGWSTPGESPESALSKERDTSAALQQDMPVAFSLREPRTMVPAIVEKWEAFQLSKGRHPGSCDLTLIEDFAFGRNYAWENQWIGSCVASNTFRGWVKRCIAQIILFGDPQEYLGLDEFGRLSIAPFAPWSYGMGRRRGNMKGGDGSYCSVQGASLLKDGILPCSSPLLVALMKQLGVDTEKNYPEFDKQHNNLYRAFGDWKYLDQLAPDACCRLLDIDDVKTLEDHIEFSKAYKPMFQCSSIAIKKIGNHSDGFAIHAQDHGNSWAHNMGQHGFFIASDGKRYHRLSNESWDDELIYNIPDDELNEWYSRSRVQTMTIGQIDLPVSVPVIG